MNASLRDERGKNVLEAVELGAKSALDHASDLVKRDRLIVININLISANKLVEDLTDLSIGGLEAANHVAAVEAHAQKSVSLRQELASKDDNQVRGIAMLEKENS